MGNGLSCVIHLRQPDWGMATNRREFAVSANWVFRMLRLAESQEFFACQVDSAYRFRFRVKEF